MEHYKSVNTFSIKNCITGIMNIVYYVYCYILTLQKVIAEFQAVASKHRGITVVCIKPQYVLLNQTDWQLRVCPLQLVPKVRMCMCTGVSVYVILLVS